MLVCSVGSGIAASGPGLSSAVSGVQGLTAQGLAAGSWPIRASNAAICRLRLLRQAMGLRTLSPMAGRAC